MSQCVRQGSVGSSSQCRGIFGNTPYSANKVRQTIYTLHYTFVLYVYTIKRFCCAGLQNIERTFLCGILVKMKKKHHLPTVSMLLFLPLILKLLIYILPSSSGTAS